MRHYVGFLQIGSHIVAFPHIIASHTQKILSLMLASNSQTLNLYLLSLGKFKSYYVHLLCSTFTVLVTPNDAFNLLTCKMLLFHTIPLLKHLTSKYKPLFVFYSYFLLVNSHEIIYLPFSKLSSQLCFPIYYCVTLQKPCDTHTSSTTTMTTF